MISGDGGIAIALAGGLGRNGDDRRGLRIVRPQGLHDHRFAVDRRPGRRDRDPRRGDVNGAARFFALPSEFINGPDEALAIHTEAEARAANATLPCGAQLISAVRRGRFISALFRLTNRPGPDGGCGSGAGQLARTNFVIVDGRILAWIRAPEVSGGGVSPLPTTPSNTQTTGPVA